LCSFFPALHFSGTTLPALQFVGVIEESAEQRLARLRETVVACRRCPRLVQYREEVARTKRRAFRDCTYWGRPVPGFGDPHARLLIIGLAPAAHGGNRTGRAFTGDRSGDFLYARLYEAGFANQPTSVDANDGLELRDGYISAAVRCAPPDNKPLPAELRNCAGYIEEEFAILRPRAVLALGAIAFYTYLRLLVKQGRLVSSVTYKFSHGAEYKLPGDLPPLFASYHPSQQNTQTGRLTPAMFDAVLRRIRRVIRAVETKTPRRSSGSIPS
jgi:uracil-DNA glycosylase